MRTAPLPLSNDLRIGVAGEIPYMSRACHKRNAVARNVGLGLRKVFQVADVPRNSEVESAQGAARASQRSGSRRVAGRH